ncbi:MAG: MBL fold metallo-hydrolase [Acidobacteria bacterium]|nr:MBL fold metallo-hydrolase [Acidobacteriota bacterium]
MGRRAILLILILLVSGALPPAAAEPPGMQVILLGTGYPRPDPERAGPSTAVVVRDRVFIVDAGRNVMTRFWQTGLPSKNLRAVLLTHLHSDHTSGLPDLFATTWIFRRYRPLELYGPEGTGKLAGALVDYFAEDIRIRRDLTEMHPGAGATISPHIVHEGVVYEDADVRITAFAVNHRPVEPAFGYRFDLLAPAEPGSTGSAGWRSLPAAFEKNRGYPSGTRATSLLESDEQPSVPSSALPSSVSSVPSVVNDFSTSGETQAPPASSPRRILYSIVISGDTRPSKNLIKHARGADILVHEVYLPEHFDDFDSPEVAARLKAYHTSADEVGQVAAVAEVKLLVLTHVIPTDGEKTILERARKHFKGRIVVGRDLMWF